MPLWNLGWFAATSEFHSCILLIPFISAYLVWLKKGSFPICSQPAGKAAAAFLTAGTVVLIAYWLVLRPRLKLMEDDYLAVMMISFLLFFFGVCSLFWGRKTLRANAFPLGFLVFMVPIPAVAMRGIDSFLQYGSAPVVQGFFRLAGTPFFQDGLVFQLPGISIQIAPECSGIHSTLVLFITSVVAGYIFLRTPWKRAVLTLFVIPLALLRNGFRVFTIGELCVHIGPQMINSPIHHRGGPIFFVLSLIPLFILLVVLHKSERVREKSKLKTGGNPNSKPPE
jgi:exosortase C (VPDSG-CTERM-specific)